MTIFKRAWLYIVRRRGRSILLFLILFIVAVLALLGLTIKSSADREMDDLCLSLAGGFTMAINSDNDSLWTENPETGYKKFTGSFITREMIGQIMETDTVSDYFVCQLAQNMWVDLTLRPGRWESCYREFQMHPERLDKPPLYHSLDFYIVCMQVTDLYGCTESDQHENFRSGAFSLTEGRHIQRDDRHTALISTYLAGENGLSVGDKITTEAREGVFAPGSGFNGPMYDVVGEPVELEIVGLFDVNFTQEPYEFMADYGPDIYQLENQFAENLIFCDLYTGNQIKEMMVDYGYYFSVKSHGSAPTEDEYDDVTFFVDDPAALNDTIRAVYEMDGIDPLDFNITVDDSAYRVSEKPLKNMSTIALIMLLAAVAGCVAILILLMNMWVKGRRREIGILLSLGSGRKAIILQLLLESIIIAAAALLLAVLLTGVFSGSVGSVVENMASSQVTDETYTVEMDDSFLPVISKASADPVDLRYGLTAGNILLAALLVFGSVGLSVLISARHILKRKPREVLSTL